MLPLIVPAAIMLSGIIVWAISKRIKAHQTEQKRRDDLETDLWKYTYGQFKEGARDTGMFAAWKQCDSERMELMDLLAEKGERIRELEGELSHERNTADDFERDLGNFTYGQLKKNTRVIGTINLNSGEVSPSTDKERIAEQEAQVKELTRMEGINWVHYQDQTSQLAAKIEEAKTYREALEKLADHYKHNADNLDGIYLSEYMEAKEALDKYPKP